MDNPTTLFVTAFVDLHIPHEEHKTIDMRMGNFEKLARTGIPLAVFVSKKYVDRVMDMVEIYKNIKIHKIVEIEDTYVYKLFESYKDNLPSMRYEIKDKFEFLSLMNAKLEFMRDAMNTYGTMFMQYAWIDFNIWYIFKNDLEVTKQLQFYVSHRLKDGGVHIPGCWQRGREGDLLWNKINWRFCGGFFMGASRNMKNFVDIFFNNIERIIHEKKILTWEVNIWSHLENECGWEPRWYYGDHNESMIHIANHNFIISELDSNKYIYHNTMILPVLTKLDGAVNGKYLLPPMPGYELTSTAFINYEGKKILNVRYVNYTLTPHGGYIVRHPRGFLKTKNVRVYLNDAYEVLSSNIMSDMPTGVETKYEHIQGIEDIRLFEHDNTLMYIGTQREFSNQDVNRMIIGQYSDIDLMLTNTSVIEPPEFTGCEKNWVPINRNGELQFIYKWYPMQIGVLENNKLVIRNEYKLPPIFERMRGSTTFIPYKDSMLGVIHYSEEGSPRKYFHALVWLDKDTYKPTHISNTFVFNKLGIEFCIGFTVEPDEHFRFWFSQHDRDMAWTQIPITDIERYSL